MKTKQWMAIATSLWLAYTAGGQVIDSFDTAQFIDVPAVPLATAGLADAAPEALGGERDLHVHRLGGLMDSLYGDVNLTVPNGASLSCGPGVVGMLHIVYDGADGDHDNIAYTGLLGLDLTEGGAYNAFTFATTSDLGAVVLIRVFTDASNYSEVSIPVAADPSFTLVDQLVPFTDFVASGGTGADFSNVGAIEVTIGEGPAGSDISMTTLSRSGPPPPPPPPPGEFCQKTQGYWKNHAEAWPVTSLTLGDENYTQAELLAIFNTAPQGNASLILAHQLIAAKLNLAAGSDPSITAMVNQGDALLAPFAGKLPYTVAKNSTVRAQMIATAALLDEYNNACEQGGN